MNLLRPDLYVDSLSEIPVDDLFRMGIKGFVLDLDNTITEWNNRRVAPEVAAWLSAMQKRGFKICIASNNSETRVVKVAEELGVPFFSKAGKPRRRSFRKALSLLGLEQGQLAVVGDQIFTDVLGGNRAGLFTILVVPLSPVEFFGTRLMRKAERLVLPYLAKEKER